MQSIFPRIGFSPNQKRAVAVKAEAVAENIRPPTTGRAHANVGIVGTSAGMPNREISLSDLKRGRSATVSAVLPARVDEDRELVLRLIEIGFVPGERVRVIAHGHPGREPIALRIGGASGGTTFALRRFEANYIRVIPETAAAKRA